MTIPQGAVDTPPTHAMVRVVRVRQREALEDAESGFDQIQPRSLGRRRHRLDAEAPE